MDRQIIRSRRLWGIGAAVLLCLAISILLGRYPKPYITPLSAIRDDALALNLILNLRMPRILSALLIGMVLSAAGAVFQMIFRNPLVDSGFLGVSQGAAFGASMAIVFLGGTAVAVQGSAAVFAFLGLAASYILARRIRLGDWVLRLVMAGIAVSALYSAATGGIKYLADPNRHLPDIIFWMLGGLWAITWKDVLQILPVIVPCLVVLYLLRWRLNLLSLRDETAFSLGVAPGRERLILLVAAVASTAAAESVSLSSWLGRWSRTHGSFSSTSRCPTWTSETPVASFESWPG